MRQGMVLSCCLIFQILSINLQCNLFDACFVFHFQTLQLELTFTIVNSANGNESKILATQRFKQG